MIIKRQIEPNYNISRNGKEYSEVRFVLADGRIFAGLRDCNESPRACRRRFLAWNSLRQNHRDPFEFERIDDDSWSYNSAYELEFDSKGNRVN